MMDTRWFVVLGILLAVAICGLWRRERNTYLQRRAQMNDARTLLNDALGRALHAGKPRAAGLKCDRITADRRVVPMLRRTK